VYCFDLNRQRECDIRILLPAISNKHMMIDFDQNGQVGFVRFNPVADVNILFVVFYGTYERITCMTLDWFGQIFARHLSDVNPTLVNDKPIVEDRVLQNGDVIEIGGRKFRIDDLVR
jgi:pSer/pThr/pTyr-binding forkhead associated (FHA) protein